MEELQKSDRFRIVDKPGPNTLIVSGGLLDVTSQVPPKQVGSSSRIYLSSIGDATLVLEIRDSETNRILARAVDRHRFHPATLIIDGVNTAIHQHNIRRLSPGSPVARGKQEQARKKQVRIGFQGAKSHWRTGPNCINSHPYKSAQEPTAALRRI